MQLRFFQSLALISAERQPLVSRIFVLARSDDIRHLK
jgi:hypothetical protein